MIHVDVQLACDEANVPDEETIRDWIERAVAAADAPGKRDLDVSLRIVDADEMQDLNKGFREQDKATNVLSFPAGEVAGLPEDAALPLGDIVVCGRVVTDEAATQKKPVADHWAHLLVHGTLHLLGYDHIDDAEAARMESLETRILADAGLPDPYRVQ